MSYDRNLLPLPSAAPDASVLAVRGEAVERRADRLAGEEPLQIRAAGPGQEPIDVAVTMRTPGEERELAAGFLVTEGLAAPADVVRAGFTFADPATHSQPHDEVVVRLPVAFDASVVAERTAVATASCGICGKASIDDVAQRCAPLPAGPIVARSVLLVLPERMRAAQAVFERTGGLHATALFTADGELLRLHEDVGRHNALDKLIGNALLERQLPLADEVLVLSGRVSFEMVQKAAVAGFPAICAVSAPSGLAVEAAERFGQTLVGFVRDGSANVYTRAERVDVGR